MWLNTLNRGGKRKTHTRTLFIYCCMNCNEINEWMNEFHYIFCILFICFFIAFVCAFVRKKNAKKCGIKKKRIRCVLNVFLNGFCAINFCCLRLFRSVFIHSFIHSFIMNDSFWWMTFNFIFIVIVFMNCFKTQMLTNFIFYWPFIISVRSLCVWTLMCQSL